MAGNGNGNGHSGNGHPPRKAAKSNAGLWSGIMRTVVPSSMRASNSASGERGSGGGPARGLTIYDALTEFFAVEDLGGDNCYRCEKCAGLQRARKHLRTLELPPVLTIHMKRFRFGSSAKKSDTRVGFPLSGLTLDAFAAARTPSSKAGSGGNGGVGAVYDLVSVIVHHGSMLTSGHYTAYVRVYDRWYHMDDGRVTPVSEETVESCEAYVLCYERRQDQSHTAHRQRVLESIRRAGANGGAGCECGETKLFGGRQASTCGTCVSASGGAAGGETMLLSLGWFARFLAMDAPGPVTHADALCPHNAVDAFKASAARSVDQTLNCFVHVPIETWKDLTSRYQQEAEVAAPLSRLVECPQCQLAHQNEQQALHAEREEISKLDSTKLQAGQIWFIVDASWLKHWREYCWEATRTDPPGPVCNWRLLAGNQPRPNLQRAKDYRGVNLAVRSHTPFHDPCLAPSHAFHRLVHRCGASSYNGTVATRRSADTSSTSTDRPRPCRPAAESASA